MSSEVETSLIAYEQNEVLTVRDSSTYARNDKL